MAIRHRRFASVPPMVWSSKRSRSFDVMPASRTARAYLLGSPVSRADKVAYDRRAHDYLNDRVSDASYFSSYAMEAGYDTARKSRNRDAQLLRDATDAISRQTSIEPGASSSSADDLFGPRRFPRRFGKPTARKNRSSGFYGPRITREVERLLPFPRPELGANARAPSSDWRNYARARSASVARSRFEDDVAVERPAFKTRAQSVGPSLLRSSAPGSLLSRRSSLPPSPALAALRRVPSYLPFDVDYDYEPDFRPLPRRHYKVLATRRPPGNYYDRMLRKRGRIQGRPIAEYVPESSLVGSNLSGALSRVGPMNDYSGASLLLSIEGTGVSSEGRRVGFTYTPTPIPLFGSTLGVDERFLSSRMNLQPLDSFLSGYEARMGALKNELNHSLNRDKARRSDLGLRPLAIGPRPIVTYIPPVVESLPVPERPLMTTVMRSVGPDQRLDVIPLGNIRPRLPRSAANKLLLPQGLTAGGVSLSMLDKINIKAALIASRMEADSFKGRRPRSDYAARKYRAMRMGDQESIYSKSPQTTSYYASNPTLPKLTERKAIRTDDGYTKPKNLLSWQYRLDSLMRPRDLMYQPTGSFDRIRQQVRMAQDGMDRHRQMLDRYLPEEGADSSDAAARVLRKMAEMDKRYPMADGGASERQRATCGIDPANPPMSDLRRRIRRTLNKTKRP